MADVIAQETGEVITSEMIEALAVEAEEGYDLSLARAVRVGRPALEKGSAKSPLITYRVPASLYKAARQKAKSEGQTLSQVNRRLLKHYIES